MLSKYCGYGRRATLSQRRRYKTNGSTEAFEQKKEWKCRQNLTTEYAGVRTIQINRIAGRRVFIRNACNRGSCLYGKSGSTRLCSDYCLPESTAGLGITKPTAVAEVFVLNEVTFAPHK